jgi:hypothetical protein
VGERFVDTAAYLEHAATWGPGSNRPMGLAYLWPDALHILACDAVPLQDVLDIVPRYFVSEHQKKAPEECCRTVENLSIEAWYSQVDIQIVEGRPDIYKFHCKECMRCHVRMMATYRHPAMQGKKLDPELLKFSRPMW